MSNYDIQQETLHSPFNIETHKKVFINYLEVIIDEDGVVHYAVPSHQEWLIEKSLKILGINREDLYDECPNDYLFDVMTWLTDVTKSISVWDDRYIGQPNDRQIKTLKLLKEHDLYRGDIPESKIETLLNDMGVHKSIFNEITVNDNNSGMMRIPKIIGQITLCGCIHFDITDQMPFIKPTSEQIKNLHDTLCIDVELFDDGI